MVSTLLMEKRVTVEHALVELARWQAASSLERAFGCLEQWCERPTFLLLYQHYFPGEYAASPARTQALPEEGLSQREIEFLNLVGQRLFPLEPDWVVQQAIEKYVAGEDFMLCIPIESVVPSPDEWDEERQPIVNVFGMLFGESQVDEVHGHLAALGVNLPKPIEPQPGRTESVWQHFQSLCTTKGEQLSGVPQLLDLIYHNTGNFWLDYDPELWYPPEASEWTIENIDALAAEWRAAEPILEAGIQTLDRLVKQPEGLVEIIECWNRAVQETARGDRKDAKTNE